MVDYRGFLNLTGFYTNMVSIHRLKSDIQKRSAWSAYDQLSAAWQAPLGWPAKKNCLSRFYHRKTIGKP